jgi:hypothetical protein
MPNGPPEVPFEGESSSIVIGRQGRPSSSQAANGLSGSRMSFPCIRVPSRVFFFMVGALLRVRRPDTDAGALLQIYDTPQFIDGGVAGAAPDRTERQISGNRQVPDN